MLFIFLMEMEIVCSHAITSSQETAICHCSMIIKDYHAAVAYSCVNAGPPGNFYGLFWSFSWQKLRLTYLTIVTKEKHPSHERKHFVGGSHKTWILPGMKNNFSRS